MGDSKTTGGPQPQWVEETNDNLDMQSDGNRNHRVKMAAKAFVRDLESEGIPSFVAYYLPGKGYKYRATFPEEIGSEELESEFGKFKKFLQVCIDFNKEDGTVSVGK